MKVSEVMKYPKLKELLRINWNNDKDSGEFGKSSMSESLVLGFDWINSKTPLGIRKEEAFGFWGVIFYASEEKCKALYPDLFTLEEEKIDSVRFAEWCVAFKHSSEVEEVTKSALSIKELPEIPPLDTQLYELTPSDDIKRKVKVEDLNNTATYQLIARLLLNTSHECNGHKQVVFKTHITHKELLGIADCINKIIEEEYRDGFVTIRWSGPKCVDLYIDGAWDEEENNRHRDQLIASWEW